MFPSSSHPDAAAWKAHADELARFVMVHLVNRADVYGTYVPPHLRAECGVKARTAPRKADRGFLELTIDDVREHFSGRAVIGLHAQSDGVNDVQSSIWCAFDIDAHCDPSDVIAQDNLNTAIQLCMTLIELGAYPLLEYSCDRGGFHVWIRFSSALPTRDVYQWALAAMAKAGVTAEVFPKQSESKIGNWLRLPGPHHTRSYYSRFWSDRNGVKAVHSFLAWAPTPASLVPAAPSVATTPRVSAPRVDPRPSILHVDGFARLRAYIAALPTGLSDGQGRNNIAYRLAARCLEEMSRRDATAVVEAWNSQNYDLLSDAAIDIAVENAMRYGRRRA